MSIPTRNHRPGPALPALVAGVLLAAGPVLLEGRPLPAPPADPVVSRSGPDTVRVAALQRWPPYYRWSEDGEPTGFAVASFREIAARAGLVPVFRRFSDFPSAIEAFRRGEVDVIPNMGDVPIRREWAHFTSPVQTFSVVLFTREAGPDLEDLSDLTGRTVGVVRENIGAVLLADRPEVAREVYAGLEEVLFGLLAGEVDAVVYPRPVLLALARDIGADDEIRASRTALAEVRRTVGVQPERAALHARLDSAVSAYVGSAAYERAYRQWFGRPQPFWTVERVAWTAAGGFLALLLLAAGSRYRTLQRLNRKLRDSERRFRQLAENIEEVFWLRDPESEEILYVSPAYEEIWGRPVAEVYEDPGAWLRAIHPDDREHVREIVIRGGATSFSEEYRIVRPDGEIRWIRDEAFPVRDEEGKVYRVAGVAQDVTEGKRMEEQLRRAALHDPLTGLANRTLLQDRIEQALARGRRRSEPIGLLLLDLDRFKRINDSLGHTAGDRVLEEVARRLEDSVREEDTVARWGGDEFCVLLASVEGQKELDAIRRRLIQRAARPIRVMGEDLPMQVTAGGVLVGPGSLPGAVSTADPGELIRCADQALHRAQAAADTSFRLFQPEWEAGDPKSQLRLEKELRRGVESGEFEPFYQPIVELATGRVWGVEPLARWRHPDRGLVEPAEFIPLAEETGLIHELGMDLLVEAFGDVAAWNRDRSEEDRICTTVNVSGRQFESEDFPEKLDEALDATGMDRERVCVEVTETSIMRTTGAIDELRGLGVRVFVDDFGTGYSSFLYLRDLELDGLKIGMSFVQGLETEPHNEAIVRTILKLGEELDLAVIAEGIETTGQLELLRRMGCSLGQGYHFARPKPAGEAADFLDAAFSVAAPTLPGGSSGAEG